MMEEPDRRKDMNVIGQKHRNTSYKHQHKHKMNKNFALWITLAIISTNYGFVFAGRLYFLRLKFSK